MSHGVKVRVWGDFALFTRPEMKVERCSYDVMTPSAARGILEAIYWHPGMRWKIDRIYVCRPIQFTSVRRNEVKGKVSAGNAVSYTHLDVYKRQVLSFGKRCLAYEAGSGQISGERR